ncbi:MAG TPA: hypothetical protein VNT03_00230 [Baekduia sp.]|nr:hypothetical protein [Baekduia sp.]
MARAVQRLVALSIVTAAAAQGFGCGSGERNASAAGALLRVSERDFRITAPAAVHAGDLRLVMRNPGPDDHELIVVRAPTSGALPMRRDGLTVDEDALEHVTAAVIEPQRPGTVSVLELHLAPGRYMLLCNMSGHFLGGMHTTVIAR